MEQTKKVPVLRFPEFSGEWEEKILKELADKITDGTHDTPKPVSMGIPFLTAIHIRDGYIDYEKCYFLDEEIHNSIYKRCNPEKYDLLIVNIGAGTATCALNTVDYEFSLKNVALIKPNKSKIDGKFLSQIQRNKSKKIFNQLTSGGAQPFLSLNEIGKLYVSFPTLPEQQKIADFLTQIDNKINQLSQKKQLLERYKKGVMQQIFSQSIRFKDDDGREFPEWEEKELGNVTSIIMGQSPDSKSYNDMAEGKPLIQGNADISNRKTCPRIWTSKPTKECKTNDIILTVRAPVGAVAKSYHNACIGRGVCAIRNNDKSTIDFIYQLLLWFEPTKWVSLEQGSTFTAVNSNDIRMLIIPVPSLPEQTKIANFLTALDDKIALVEKQLNGTKRYKKGLLQQLFV